MKFSPLGNDKDPNNGVLNLESLTTPSHGAAGFIGATVAYTPTLNFTGTDVFTYTVSTGVKNTQACIIVLVSTNLKRLFVPAVKK